MRVPPSVIIPLLALAASLATLPAASAEPLDLETLLASGRYLEAAAEAVEAVDRAPMGPDRSSAAARAGQVYLLYLEMADRAAPMFERAIEEAPHAPSAGDGHYFLGRIAYQNGDLLEAVTRLRTVVQRFGDGPRAHNAQFMLELAEQAVNKGTAAPELDVPPPSTAPRPVRVLIIDQARQVQMRTQGALQVSLDGRVKSTLPRSDVRATASGGQVVLDGRTTGKPRVWVSSGRPIQCQDRRCRGKLRLDASGHSLTVIEEVPLEDYLRGVLPREVPPGWPGEALKAQCVASRSYVVYHQDRRRDKPYDVKATVQSQVYGGADAEDPRTDRAVRSTKGKVLTHRGRPILAYFHSHSGGHVADDAEVWPTDLPYLAACRDPYGDGAPDRVTRWSLRLSASEVAQGLGVSGTATAIALDSTGPSGRVHRIRSRIGNRSAHASGERFRMRVGASRIRSTLFTVRNQNGSTAFLGRGFGHGVGMSQWGARGMAVQGKTYGEILAYYYPGTTLEKL